MSEIAPDRSAAILARARVYGESRVVCGVHYESDVQAGRLAGSALFSALQGDTAFRQDLNAARDEVMKLEAAGLPPPSTQCALEADASAHPIW